jgi:DNA-binding sugar fermentation-stimulating protein
MGKAIHNKLVGDFSEDRFEAELHRKLPYNYERQQVHGESRADFILHDNDGVATAVVECKSGGFRDAGQARRLVRLAETTKARTLYLVTKHGDARQFSPAVKDVLRQAKAEGKILVKFFDIDKPRDAARGIASHVRLQLRSAGPRPLAKLSPAGFDVADRLHRGR